MSIKIIKRPNDGVVYSLDQVPDIILSTDEVISAWLWIYGDNEPFFQGSYQPDFSGLVRISMKGLYEKHLQTELPTEHNEPQYLFNITFRIVISGSAADHGIEMTYSVANSRLHREQSYSDFIDSNFLTNQPSVKDTTFDAPEFLAYLAKTGNRTVVARFYTSDNTAHDVTVASGGGCRIVNVSPARLLKMIATVSSLKGYYDILLKQGNAVVASQRYMLRRTYGFEKYYCFVNALGGSDTLISRRDNIRAPETTFETGRLGNTRVALDNSEDINVWKQNLRFPSRLRNWVKELLTEKKQVAICLPQGMPEQEIVLTGMEFSVGDREELATASFSYMMSAQSDEPYSAKSAEGETSLSISRNTESKSADEVEEEEENESIARDYTHLIRGGNTVCFEALGETGRMQLEGSGDITMEVSVDGINFTALEHGFAFDNGVAIMPFKLTIGDLVRISSNTLDSIIVNFNHFPD